MQRQKQALRLIQRLRSNLEERINEAQDLGSLMSTSEPALQAMKMWRIEAVQKISIQISSEEAQYLEGLDADRLGIVDPLNIVRNQLRRYNDFLNDLEDAIKDDPEGVFMTDLHASPDREIRESQVSASTSREKVVFIIHGHDEANQLKLRDLLEVKYKLKTVILSYQPGRSQALMEKFETEAARAHYAFALLTPDDIIKAESGEYVQARPNVIFELGWFCGRLGRGSICILLKKGTNIHSDIEGISRIEFIHQVNEKIEEIERELRAADLL